jgi:predicted enzyme related to lactoylglutathione lyase
MPSSAAGGRSGSTPARAPTSHSGSRKRSAAAFVECRIERPLWLPYVEVSDVARATDQARLLGASVLLEPREGPAGWRSVVAARSAGEVAFWQPKR